MVAPVEDDLKTKTSLFKEALKHFEREVDPKYRTGFDYQGDHTWQQVLSTAKSAHEKYEGKDKHFFHRMCRKFGKHAAAVDAWLKLLPTNEWYTSVLCGGLRMILAVSRNGCGSTPLNIDLFPFSGGNIDKSDPGGHL